MLALSLSLPNVIGRPYFPFIYYEVSRPAAVKEMNPVPTHIDRHHSYEYVRIISQI